MRINKIVLASAALAAIICSNVTFLSQAEAATPCSREKQALSRASSAERSSEAKLNSQVRRVESMSYRFENTKERAEQSADKCQDRIENQIANAERQQDSFDNRIIALEAKIQDLLTQAVLCEFEQLAGRYCPYDKFKQQASKYAAQRVALERQKDHVEDQSNRKVQNQIKNCDREKIRKDKEIARDAARLVKEQNKVPPLEAKHNAAIAATLAADVKYNQCLDQQQ